VLISPNYHLSEQESEKLRKSRKFSPGPRTHPPPPPTTPILNHLRMSPFFFGKFANPPRYPCPSLTPPTSGYVQISCSCPPPGCSSCMLRHLVCFASSSYKLWRCLEHMASSNFHTAPAAFKQIVLCQAPSSSFKLLQVGHMIGSLDPASLFSTS
jgi:hypothetical protein